MVRNAARTSSTKSAGCSKAAKCPPGRRLVPVAQVREAPLGPAPRRAEDLLGEDRRTHRHGHGDRRARAREALPVEAGRRRAGGRQPVVHDVVEQPVAGERVLRVRRRCRSRPRTSRRSTPLAPPASRRGRSRRSGAGSPAASSTRCPTPGGRPGGQRRLLGLGELAGVLARADRDHVEVDAEQPLRVLHARGTSSRPSPSRRPARRSGRSRARSSAGPTRRRCARRPNRGATACR